MADDLTPDERAELESLRAAKNHEVIETPVNPDVSLPPTHWLWLANGTVLESNGVKSHHEGIPVVAAYEKPSELVNPPAPAHVY